MIFLCQAWFVPAQIIISGDDMPAAGDTIRQSITYFLEGIDYEQTGPDHTWDFSGLTVMSQQVDTFIQVSSTPLLYQIVFNNQFLYPDHQATCAGKMPELGMIPGYDVTDTYRFFRATQSGYREVGLAATLAGIPLAVPYDEIDVIYSLPMSYAQLDSAESGFELSVPGLGFIASQRKRVNHADGWGTLTTPFGEHQVIRVKTTIHQYDSLYADTLGMGFPLIRNYTEYKWIARDFGLPLLTVTQDGLIVSASYIDSLRTTFLGLNDPPALEFDFRVYPNPSTEFFTVSYELFHPARVRMALYSVSGRFISLLFELEQERGLYNRIIYPGEQGIKPGMYLLVVEVGGKPHVRRILIR